MVLDTGPITALVRMAHRVVVAPLLERTETYRWIGAEASVSFFVGPRPWITTKDATPSTEISRRSTCSALVAAPVSIFASMSNTPSSGKLSVAVQPITCAFLRLLADIDLPHLRPLVALEIRNSARGLRVLACFYYTITRACGATCTSGYVCDDDGRGSLRLENPRCGR